ncbi:hypothetical protein SS05631_b56510 (plasmid) [Sinorhizobium sp. CCBAU 05631]|nr:hypothetical protein SS05631_b56510 [Sinorhizobium sp. CCBAU 05631]
MAFDPVEGPQTTPARVQPIDDGDEGARFLQHALDLRRLDVQMLRQKRVAKACDRGTLLLVRRLHRNVALGIEPFRTVVEIRRPDPKKPLVDSDHLGMDDHLLFGAVRRRDDGIGDPQPAVAIRPLQPPDKAVAIAPHHHPFEKPVRTARRDDHDLGSVGLLQPLAQNLADPMRGEILVLDIDVAPGAAQSVEGEPQRFLPPTPLAEARLGAGDPDPAIGQERFDAGRPGDRRRAWSADTFADRRLPAGAAEIADRPARLALQHHLDVMDRIIRISVRIAAQVILGQVVRRVPAPGGQIDAADESDPVVDGDEFLVMRTAQRVVAGETELDLRMGSPLLAAKQSQRLSRIDRPHRPDQNADPEIRLLRDQRLELGAERLCVRIVRPQLDARIEIPSGDPDLLFGLLEHPIEAGIIGRPVHEEGHPLGRRAAPDILGFLDDRSACPAQSAGRGASENGLPGQASFPVGGDCKKIHFNRDCSRYAGGTKLGRSVLCPHRCQTDLPCPCPKRLTDCNFETGWTSKKPRS